jgi:hypothetical protein
MGSASSKQAGGDLELCQLSCDSGDYSLLPYQNGSIDSDGSDHEYMFKPDHSSDDLDSSEDDSSNGLSDQDKIPLIPPILTRTLSCGSEVLQFCP